MTLMESATFPKSASAASTSERLPPPTSVAQKVFALPSAPTHVGTVFPSASVPQRAHLTPESVLRVETSAVVVYAPRSSSATAS